jgi:hypothetical protein
MLQGPTKDKVSFLDRIGSTKVPRGIFAAAAQGWVYVSGMSLARVARALLPAGVLLPGLGLGPGLGCGERAGDPVIALSTTASSGAAGAPEPGEGAGGEAGTGGTAGAAGASEPTAPGPGGLCARCESSKECGDADDACLLRDGERFCGRDCDDQRGCPEGYGCVQLSNMQLWQCVPQDACALSSTSAPPLSDIRQYVLSRINAARAELDLEPLEPSSCLHELAQESAVDYARTDEPLGKYLNECDPVWPSCACGWSAEAEVSVARYGLDWQTAVDHGLSAYRDGSNDRFVQAYQQSAISHVGIGFWLSGDEAWIALSFQ